MVAQRRRQAGPLDPGALLPEGHARKLFLETFLLLRIAGTRQAVSQLKEALPFLLTSLDPGLDEINNDAVGARAADLRQRFHPAGDARGETYALTDGLLGNGHGSRRHHLAPEYTRNQKSF